MLNVSFKVIMKTSVKLRNQILKSGNNSHAVVRNLQPAPYNLMKKKKLTAGL